ncbi:fumarylacetoacetase [Thermaurantiacus sp.]
MKLDETHAPDARCWVPGADTSADFPVQNLPFCLFSTGDLGPRAGVAIGSSLIDLGAFLHSTGHDADSVLAELCAGPLNALLASGAEVRGALRRRLFAILTDPSRRGEIEPFLVPMAEAELHVPCEIGDYSDFYAGIHHATRVGRLFRPDNPLLPNYRHIPIGYHGRASSVVVSGTPVRRPAGQIAGPEGPRFQPSARLDHEFELGILVGPGNLLGHPIPISEAADHIAGFTLLNDWSARDIQAWEYQPLGPFLAKSFATTLSPFIVTPEALAPFRCPAFPRGKDDPAPLPYLLDPQDQAEGGLSLTLETFLSSAAMREQGMKEVRIASQSATNLYWTPAQMIAHHSSNGCNLRPGDLLGTGTISGEGQDEAGSLLELTDGGTRPITLPTGETRTFLLAGDRLRLAARGERPGFRSIGFGPCVGEIIG